MPVSRPALILPFVLEVLVASACSGGSIHVVGHSGSVADESDGPSPPWPEPDTGASDEGIDDASTTASPDEEEHGDDTSTGGDACVFSSTPEEPGACPRQPVGEGVAVHVGWAWIAPGGGQAAATPLVGRLTDDDGNGVVNACDPPDVVALVHRDLVELRARLWILDGATGIAHREVATDVSPVVTPALGDLDGDGAMEIVAQRTTADGDRLVAFDGRGAIVWEGAQAPGDPGAIALVDLDGDGTVEILRGSAAYSAQGELVWDRPASGIVAVPLAADLDGDGLPEVLHGPTALTGDGEVAWQVELDADHAVVADVDDDDEPEVVVLASDGLAVIEHDGALAFRGRLPIDVVLGGGWVPPIAIADLDDDGAPEILFAADDRVVAVDGQGQLVWALEVDGTSRGAPTAFDLQGDGKLEVIYAGVDRLYIADHRGELVAEPTPRVWEVGFDNPIVADVDLDGAAEIIVASGAISGAATFTIQVLESASQPWVGARALWNQHAYQVTNVDDDGSIPTVAHPHWRGFNRTRANVRVDGDALCRG